MLTCNRMVAYHGRVDPTFAAVADPTRRALLDRLRADGPLALSALASTMPMTRQAVTKHLAVLVDAGLVGVDRRGRERIHRLQPAPLRVVDAWLAPYAAEWDERLAALRQHIEQQER